MTWAQVALEDFPVALWVLDGTTPHLDYTGFNNSATSKVVEATNLIAGLPGVTLGNSTIATNVAKYNLNWNQVTANTINHGVRWDVGTNVMQGGKTYTASVEVVNNGSADVVVSLDVSDAPGASIQLKPGEVKRLTASASRSDYNSPYHFVDMAIGTIGIPVLYRNWILTEGSQAVAHFDGSTKGKELNRNHVFNPSAQDLTSWYWNASISAASIEAGRFKLVFNGAAGMSQGLPDSAVIPVSQGDKAILSFDYQGPGGGHRAIVHQRSSAGAIVTQDTILLPNSPNAVTRVTLPVTTAAGVTSLFLAQLIYGISAVPANETHYFDNILFIKTNESNPAYFDGNSNDGRYDYYWLGTPYNSPSIRAQKGYTFETAGTTALMVAPNQWHAALVKGASRALIVSDSQRLSVNAPIMKRGKEDQPFSIEVTIRPIKRESSTAQQQIFGNPSVMDGLVISGTKVSFSTKYTSSGEAKCEFDVQEYQTMRILAKHTKSRNALYINGDLVDEAILTDEQKADTYSAAGEALSCGASTSTNAIAMNGLAIYTRALDEGDIDQHNDEAADNMDEFTVGAAYGGMTFALNSSTSKAILEYNYTDDWQWHMGMMTQVIVAEGQLVPQTSADVSLPGTWETVLPLPPSTNLSSITMNWLGENEKVYTSLDGVNWTQERRSARISTVSDGFDTTDKVLYLRVAFDGGKLNDPAYFDSLVVSMYGPVNTTMPSLETRTMTLTNGSIEVDFDVTDYHENWGIEINNGTFSLSGASATAMAPRTIQVWARKGTGAFSDNMQAAANTWYTNDTTVAQDYQTDEWQLRTYVFPSGWTDAITFTGSGQIGCVLIYPNALTLDQIKESYFSFTGTRTVKFPTSGSMSIIDISSAVEIYEYNWGIESAG